MSENEPTQQFGQKITVKVDSSPKEIRLAEELEAMRSEKEALEGDLSALAEKAFSEKKDELIAKYPDRESIISGIENPSELTLVEGLLSGEPEKTERAKPSGVVSLQDKSKGSDNIMRKEFPDARSMVQGAMDAEMENPEMGNVVNELFKKSMKGRSGNWQLDEGTPKIPSPNGRYCIYTNSKGLNVYVPENHAKTLKPEILAKRLLDGWYG